MTVPSPPRETREERAIRLAPLAVEWAARIRDEDVDDLARELLDPLPRLDLYALIGLLGAAADVSTSPEIWWGWARHNVREMKSPRPRVDPELTADRLTSEEVDLRIAELTASGNLTYAEIGKVLGMPTTAVAKRCQRLGVRSLPRGDVTAAREQAARERAAGQRRAA